ncbi:MAG: BatD family protein [Acuticoccus sp.]
MIRFLLLAAVLGLWGAGAHARGLDIPFQSNRTLREQAPPVSNDADTDGTAQDPTVASAAASQPMLQVDFPETEAIPGQPLNLRVTVLVPTFMTKPPVWPTLEMPNLLVRLPEGATNPTSQRVGGETWSGITRRYQLSPMVPGDFTIPPQEVSVTWTPDGGTPQTMALPMPAVTLKGVLPEGAEGLDPFLAAASLDLTQQIEGTSEGMVAGDSFARTVTVKVDGVPPMFVPPLLPPGEIAGLAAYRDNPVVEEANNRGKVSGTRTERVTYVAEGGGAGTLPAVSLDWFDIDGGAVETASLDGVAVSIDGPPAASAAPRDWRAIATAVLVMLVAAVIAIVLILRIAPRVRRFEARRHAAHVASEDYAWHALQRTVARREDAALRPALDLWAERVRGADPRQDDALEAALLALGAARYGTPGEGGDRAAAWAALAAALPAARHGARAHRLHGSLPPLNPGGAPG